MLIFLTNGDMGIIVTNIHLLLSLSLSDKRRFLENAVKRNAVQAGLTHIIAGDFNFTGPEDPRYNCTTDTFTKGDVQLAAYWADISTNYTEWFQAGHTRSQGGVFSRLDRIYSNHPLDVVHFTPIIVETLGNLAKAHNLSEHLPVALGERQAALLIPPDRAHPAESQRA